MVTPDSPSQCPWLAGNEASLEQSRAQIAAASRVWERKLRGPLAHAVDQIHQSTRSPSLDAENIRRYSIRSAPAITSESMPPCLSTWTNAPVQGVICQSPGDLHGTKLDSGLDSTKKGGASKGVVVMWLSPQKQFPRKQVHPERGFQRQARLFGAMFNGKAANGLLSDATHIVPCKRSAEIYVSQDFQLPSIFQVGNN